MLCFKFVRIVIVLWTFSVNFTVFQPLNSYYLIIMIEVLLTCYTKDVLTKYIKFINHFNSNISFLTPTFLLLSVQSGRERERLYLLSTVYCILYCILFWQNGGLYSSKKTQGIQSWHTYFIKRPVHCSGSVVIKQFSAWSFRFIQSE